MPTVEDRLHELLERAQRTVVTSGVSHEVTRRRDRMVRRRSLGMAGLAVVVIVGSVAGVLLLSHVFREAKPATPATPFTGTMVVETGTQDSFASSRIEEVPLAGGSPSVLVEVPDADHEIDGMSVAPDGHAIAYAVTTYSGIRSSSEIKVLDLVTGDQRTLASGAGPAWSPDGSTIAYGNWDDNHIYVVAADGSSAPQVVPHSGAPGGAPSWSPDGSWLTWEQWDGTSRIGVVAVNLATGEHRWLAATDGNHPAEPVFSQDGSSIVYSTQGAIWSVPLDRSTDQTVIAGVANPDSSKATAFVTPGWTPDGHLVYIKDISNGLPPILVDATDGSGPTELGHGFEYGWLRTSG